MTAHLSGPQIARYLARILSPADVLALHEHIETCADCRQTLERAAMGRSPSPGVPFFTDAPEPHLTEEELVAFAARRLPEARRTQAARHMALCSLCLDSVEAMEAERQVAVLPVGRPGFPWLAAAGIAAGLLVAALALYGSFHRGAAHPNGAGQQAILASLRDAGGTIELDAQGALRGLDAASPEERSLVGEALRKGSLPAGPALTAEPPGVLLGPPGSAPTPFAPVAPLDTRVLSDHPLFTWRAYPGAERYEVLVTDETLEPVARSGPITATEWHSETPLPRGAILLWQVRAWHGGEVAIAPAPPAPPARFQIAGEQAATRIEQLRHAAPPSHLLAAVVCAREGLREEAAKEMEALAAENPGSKVVASLAGISGR